MTRPVGVYHHCAAVAAALHPFHELNDWLLGTRNRNLRRRASDVPQSSLARDSGGTARTRLRVTRPVSRP